jgi:hypothetical protein
MKVVLLAGGFGTYNTPQNLDNTAKNLLSSQKINFELCQKKSGSLEKARGINQATSKKIYHYTSVPLK